MSGQDGQSGRDGFGENRDEHFGRIRGSSGFSSPPASGASAGSSNSAPSSARPPGSNPEPPAASAPSATDLQYRLAELYAQEHLSGEDVFDSNYLRMNQKELAKAYVEQHKEELADSYLAYQYAREHALDDAYVDQYPEQLAQNYIMGHSIELARTYLQDHRVELSEEFLLANQMDLAQSLISERQFDLAQRYVLECSERLFRLAAQRKPATMLPTLEIPAPVSNLAPAREDFQTPAILSSESPAPLSKAADIPTLAILTGTTGEFSAPVNGNGPSARPRPRSRLSAARSASKRPDGMLTPAEPLVQSSEPQVQSAAQSRTAEPYVPAAPAEPAPTQAPAQSYSRDAGYERIQPSEPQQAPPSASQRREQSTNQPYNRLTPGYKSPESPESPAQSYAPPSTSQVPAEKSPPAYSQSEQAAATGRQASFDPYASRSERVNPPSEKPSAEERTTEYDSDPGTVVSRDKHAPPPLSGSYSSDRSPIPWEQLSQVPLSSFDHAEPPPFAGSGGFGGEAPPLQSGYTNQPAYYQEGPPPAAGMAVNPPPGMQQLMSGLSQSAMAAQSNSGKSLSRLIPPPPALRSEGAAAEVTSAWF